MSKLSTKAREKLKSSDFAIPGKREYPIQDIQHARMALAMVSKYGTPAEKKQVRAAVHRRYPGIHMEAVMGKREKDRDRQKRRVNGDGDGPDRESAAEDRAEN